MADDNVKVVITVDGNTADAVRAMGKLQGALEDTGKKAEKTGMSIGGMIKGVAAGFATFNQAAEGVGKVFDFLGKSIDTALDQQRMANLEKMLPTGAVDRFREATDKMISRQDVLRLSVKGLTGDFKISNDQMQTVLQTAVALSQKTGESADVIGDKLLDALAKGVNKLDDFGINLEKTGDRQADVNAAMSKFKDIIAENPVDEQTKSLMEMKDAINELTVALSGLIATFARGAAAAFRYGTEMYGYVADWDERSWQGGGDRRKYGLDDDATAVDLMIAKQKNREGIFGYTAGINAIKGMKGTYARGKERDQQPYFQGMSDEDYATSLGFQTEGNLVDKYGTIGHKYEKKTVPVYVVNAREVGERVIYGRDNVRSLSAVAGEAGITGNTDIVQGNLKGGGGFLSESMFGDVAGGTYQYVPKKFGAYDKSDPLGSMSAALTGEHEAAGAAFDIGTSGAMAGIEAMIAGQGAVGKAIANASATALRAKAVEWGAFALGELAWGIADAARFMPTAAGHFAAAAKFGLAAAAAGLGASAISALAGGGGGSGGGGAGAAGGGYASPTGAKSGGGGSNDTIVINMGDGFYGDTGAVAEAVAQGVRAGKRRGARDDYSATYSG